jgi:hypothetical protein
MELTTTATAAELGAFLAGKGLGAFAQTFAAEQITMETVVHLTANELKEMAIPIGPRMKILKLFAADPHRPDMPAGSHDSPRHMALLEASADAPVATVKDSGKKFNCFLSHHKAACAMEGETNNSAVRRSDFITHRPSSSHSPFLETKPGGPDKEGCLPRFGQPAGPQRLDRSRPGLRRARRRSVGRALAAPVVPSRGTLYPYSNTKP